MAYYPDRKAKKVGYNYSGHFIAHEDASYLQSGAWK